MLQWVRMRSWVLEQRQSWRWAGQDGSWVPLSGVFYHVGSRFDTREDSGSGAVGRAEGRGRVVDCDSSVRARESACLSVGKRCRCPSCQSAVSWKRMRDGTAPERPGRRDGGGSPAVGVVQRRNSLTATMSPCVSPSPTGPPIPLPRSRPWSRPPSWARVGRAKSFRGEPGSTNQKLAVGLCAGTCRPVSSSARPPPSPCRFAALWPDVPSWAKETWRGRGVGMAGPSRPSALLSFLPPVSSSWMTRTC